MNRKVVAGMSKSAFASQLKRLMETGRHYTPGQLISLTGADFYMGMTWFQRRIRSDHKEYRLMSGDDGSMYYEIIIPIKPDPVMSRFYSGVMRGYNCLRSKSSWRRL